MNPLLISALSAPVEALINAVLAQDPVAANRLTRHHGRTLRVQCTQPLQWSITLAVREQRIALQAVSESEADATISGSAAAFLRLVLSRRQTEGLFSSDIVLSGDTQLLQELHSILGNLDIDWEEHFGRIFGDIPTWQGSQVLRQGRDWAQSTTSSLLKDVEEYLHEESRVLPTATELNRFSDRISALSLGLDRIAARQSQLRDRLDS